ncbi:YqaE/Pmp3 family membrane protein [Sphingomonas sp.]|uniref:YqaE/Pmp3 family membrane protein n=1 Tax=Sphingomonas sp. TaxID=28214 RepID=UPI0025EB7FB1|nr:YqaE/Pmp3 family membrane protein [Sphingomonas sp.]
MAVGRVKPLAVLAAIFLPPLGVFLDRPIGKSFWITCLLTLVAFVPGMIFALYLTLISPAA